MKYLTAILGLALCVASCSSNNAKTEENTEAETQPVVATVVVDGQWKLVSYNVADNVVTVADDADYVLNFMPEETMFNMTTDCNAIGGKYILDGDSLKFDNLMSTKMMCPEIEVENAFIQILPTVNNVAVDNDTVLELKNDGNVVAKFVKVAPEQEEAPAEN